MADSKKKNHIVSAIVAAPAGATPDAVTSALKSVLEQTPAPETIVALDGDDRALVRALATHAKDATLLELSAPTPAGLRNAAWQKARGDFICVVEPEERLASKDVLSKQVAALEADAATAASYGQTTVNGPSGARVRPTRGRGGRIQRRLVQQKELIASSASVLWRRTALAARPFDESYRSTSSLLLALSLSVAGEKPFLFQPFPAATAVWRREDLGGLEEKAKIFVALLYGARQLDEKLEQRVRFRLARHLVAIGKHHYRAGDHVKAGKFFGEAVKAAPSYFKGRRYQFLNFMKRVFA